MSPVESVSSPSSSVVVSSPSSPDEVGAGVVEGASEPVSDTVPVVGAADSVSPVDSERPVASASPVVVKGQQESIEIVEE